MSKTRIADTAALAEEETSTLTSTGDRLSALLCPRCHCSDWKPAGSVRRVKLSHCGKCNLLGTSHFVDKSRSVEALYDVNSDNYAMYKEQYLNGRLGLYSRFLPELTRFQKTYRMLEIGSGYGFFLEMAGEAKWIAEGIEISSYCCQVARERGCNVRMGHLQSLDLVPETYDVVILWDVIEHFTEPDKIIRDCRTLLRTGGALVMRTPDARALTNAVCPARTLYRNLAYPANTAEHVFHFTPRDLTCLVTQSGFHVESINCAQRWGERIISANNNIVWVLRWLSMGYAHWRKWPYEFVLTAARD